MSCRELINANDIRDQFGLLVACAGQPRLPPLSGPHKTVGVRVVQVEGAEGGGCRAKVFYPAQPAASGQIEAAYCTDGRETSDSMAVRSLGAESVMVLSLCVDACRGG